MGRVRRTERLPDHLPAYETGYGAGGGYDYAGYDHPEHGYDGYDGYGYGGYGYGERIISGPTPRGRARDRPGPAVRWHAGADLGLVLVRLALASAVLGHGARLMFGAFGGPGLAGFARFLAERGFAEPSTLAGVTAIVELGGGILVLVGLFTPLAAATLLVVLVNAVAVTLPGGFFVRPEGTGCELELVLAALAAALVLTGAGRLALDPLFPLLRRPHLVGPPMLLLGLAAAVAVRVLLHTS